MLESERMASLWRFNSVSRPRVEVLQFMSLILISSRVERRDVVDADDEVLLLSELACRSYVQGPRPTMYAILLRNLLLLRGVGGGAAPASSAWVTIFDLEACVPDYTDGSSLRISGECSANTVNGSASPATGSVTLFLVFG